MFFILYCSYFTPPELSEIKKDTIRHYVFAPLQNIIFIITISFSIAIITLFVVIFNKHLFYLLNLFIQNFVVLIANDTEIGTTKLSK
jgi:hypothetical protein